ncbi:MAG: bifunctional UDP-N-acetylmuramoyl-tripeptide:D-alanyl-D-alanine ligase/alanine racemase, partial [Chitinophagaceae bacterium]|nr:bifunctional UDP-N-acetylmuramoyl-tripeptide:D-alanyl-D-alanine ligase/alanine racemase [Chitinophagaceae bacterium]
TGRNQLGIFEAGISQSSEMENLQKIIQPGIGVFTNIGEAHNENFLNVRQKVKEKLRLFNDVEVLIYRKDYSVVHEAIISILPELNRNRIQRLTLMDWSSAADATIQVTKLSKNETGTTIDLKYKDEKHRFSISFTDEASIENAIHCWCVLAHLGIESEFVRKNMLLLEPVAMRLELKQGVNHCSIINDSYSADLNSLVIALDFLAQQHQHPKRTLILSDILESGKTEKELYEEVATALTQRRIDRLIAIGDRIGMHQSTFNKVAGLATRYYKSVDEFKKDLPQLVFRDETILLKGARIFEFEQIDRILEQQVHQTVLEVNLSALVHNFKQYQQQLNKGTKLMAMVKAFAYGSGSFEIARVLEYYKADYLGVAYADEGVELRKAGITLPIMILNIDESGFDAIVQFNLEPVMFSVGMLKSFHAYLRKQGIQEFPVHLEVETGMNRLGISLSELAQISSVIKSGVLTIQSVFSHLAASEDAKQDSFTTVQAEQFRAISSQLKEMIPYKFLQHISNSSGVSRHPSLQFDMVRLGIGLHGIDPDRSDLQEVSTLKSTIAQIKYLKAGETVSYGRRGVVLRDSVIATVRIGYADGYPASLGIGVGKMMVKGVEAPIIGKVCMDMTMIDVTEIAEVSENDEVIVFGSGLPVTRVAEWANTIPYEILSGVSQRVKRLYFEQ